MIRLNDGKPWSRRWMWIGAKPITSEGKLTHRLTLFGAGAFVLLAFALGKDSALGMASLSVAFAIVFLGAVIIVAKTDSGF